MGLLGLVLRALGVALLCATVLVPVADHHASAWLPSNDEGQEIAERVLHHHPARTEAPPDEPVVMPAVPPTLETSSAPPIAQAGRLATNAPGGMIRLPSSIASLPEGQLLEPVLRPPIALA